MWTEPSPKSKITSAVWGPLDEVIITGHENGDLCQWDISVCFRVYCFVIDYFCGTDKAITPLYVYYSFYRPRKDERLSWPSWLTYSGLPTLVVIHQLQVECRTGKVRRPETDVVPLCHATN